MFAVFITGAGAYILMEFCNLKDLILAQPAIITMFILEEMVGMMAIQSITLNEHGLVA